MHLPSFLWLWRAAAWSMGLSVVAYSLLAILGLGLRPRGWARGYARRQWRQLHQVLGFILVGLIGLLLGIGIVGTLGHFGSLGHSWHLPVGLGVAGLTAASAWLGTRMDQPWARAWHVRLNILLGIMLAIAGWTGWQVVQKYLP